MTPAEREKLNICPKCGKPTLTIMVTQIVCAPMSMLHNFTRANMRKKEFEHWGTIWENADILCKNPDGCGYTRISKGNPSAKASPPVQRTTKEKKPKIARCCVCGTTKNLHEDGWYGYRCDSADCMVF